MEIGKWYKSGLSLQRPGLLTLCVCVCMYICMYACMILCVCMLPQNKYCLYVSKKPQSGNILDEPDWSIIMTLKNLDLRGPKLLAFLILDCLDDAKALSTAAAFLCQCQWDPSPSLTHPFLSPWVPIFRLPPSQDPFLASLCLVESSRFLTLNQAAVYLGMFFERTL